MRITGGNRSNIEDRRGRAPSRGVMIGGGGGIIGIIVALLFGTGVLGGPGSGLGGQQQSGPYQPAPGEEELVARVDGVLNDIQLTWQQEFRKRGDQYQDAKLVLFTGSTDTACGMGEAVMGPFYCPGDHKAYIDLSFYAELERRFKAPGDFAQAYVLAHEIGHHVQNLRGISAAKQREMQQSDKVTANAISVRQELQADCLAGVWAFYANQRNLLDMGDLDEGLGAANAIGDDTLQRQAQGRVVPESFTHGSAEQRKRWFLRGFKSGREEDCDSFSTNAL